MRVPDSLVTLTDEGIIERVVRPLMSGKEAQVFLVVSGGEERVAKVYKEAQNRSFKQRAEYTEGRKVRNTRDQRAMEKHSRHGKEQDEAAWRSTEVDMIYRLRAAGVRVPTPHQFVDGVLIMELITDGNGNPAPRLGDVGQDVEAATQIYHQLLAEVVRMLCAGVVHGDLSDFNVLLGPDGPVIIDFPQSVSASSNQNAQKLLVRDVDNLHRYLTRFAPQAARLPYAQEMWHLYQRGELTPETRLSGRFRAAERRANTDAVLELIVDAEHDERRRRQQQGVVPRRGGKRQQPESPLVEVRRQPGAPIPPAGGPQRESARSEPGRSAPHAQQPGRAAPQVSGHGRPAQQPSQRAYPQPAAQVPQPNLQRQPSSDGRAPHAQQPNVGRGGAYARQPSSDGRAPQPQQPNVGRGAPYARQPSSDGRTPHAQQPSAERSAPYARQSRADGRALHPQQPSVGRDAPYPQQPSSDGRVPRSQQPNVGRDAPYPQQPSSDGRVPRSQQPNVGRDAPYVQQPSSDGRVPRSQQPGPERPADYAREPGSDGRQPQPNVGRGAPQPQQPSAGSPPDAQHVGHKASHAPHPSVGRPFPQARQSDTSAAATQPNAGRPAPTLQPQPNAGRPAPNAGPMPHVQVNAKPAPSFVANHVAGSQGGGGAATTTDGNPLQPKRRRRRRRRKNGGGNASAGGPASAESPARAHSPSDTNRNDK